MTTILTNTIKEDEVLDIAGTPIVQGSQKFIANSAGNLAKSSSPVVYAFAVGAIQNTSGLGATVNLEISTTFKPRYVTVDGYTRELGGFNKKTLIHGWDQWGNDGSCSGLSVDYSPANVGFLSNAFMASGEDSTVPANNNAYCLITDWKNNKVSFTSVCVAGWILEGNIKVWA